MISFPNSKINLGLRILQKRTDGFHDLESVFYPLPVHDALEIIPAPDRSAPQLVVTGLSVDIDPKKNLVYKAWELLKNDFPFLPAVHIHLHKCIPMGAGLGGGSANGAFALNQINQIFQLGITPENLQ